MITTQTISMAEISGGGYTKGVRGRQPDSDGLFGTIMRLMEQAEPYTSPAGEAEAAEPMEEEVPQEGLWKAPRRRPRAEEAEIFYSGAAQGVQGAAQGAPQVTQEAAQSEGTDNSELSAVFILEGTKEVVAPEYAQEPGLSEPAEPEGESARMPQTGTPGGPTAANSEAADTGSCPLENGNDAAVSEPEPAPVREDKERKPAAMEEQQPVNQPINVAPEKTSSHFQMRAAAETADKGLPTASADNLFDTMVERIELDRQAGSSDLTIQLRPEFLGKVSLQMTMSEGVMQVKISAEDAAVKSMISGQISALVETLSNRGISVAGVEVVYTGVPDGNLADSFGDGGQGAQSERGAASAGRTVTASGLGFQAEIAAVDLGLAEPGLSSVEYRA